MKVWSRCLGFYEWEGVGSGCSLVSGLVAVVFMGLVVLSFYSFGYGYVLFLFGFYLYRGVVRNFFG